MSLETCLDVLRNNDLKMVNNILLIHLSDSNSDEVLFKQEVSDLTGKIVNIANKGLVINFDKEPFDDVIK